MVEDYSAIWYLPAVSEEESFKKQTKGRMVVCAFSIVFEPENLSLPVIRLTFADMTRCVAESHIRGPFQGRETLFVESKAMTKMKDSGKNEPYVVDKRTMVHRFSINFSALKQVYPLVKELFLTSQLDDVFKEGKIQSVLLRMEEHMIFDPSWLENLGEVRRMEVRASRVKPLVEIPGRVMLTNARLYFQPVKSVGASPILKYRLSSITTLFKRRHKLRSIGMEIFFDGSDGQFGSDSSSVSLFSKQSSLYLTFSSSSDRDSLYESLVQLPGLQHLRLSSSLASTNMTSLWKDGKVSNFDYLMFLNTMADRSFNDLTQYPVFPWVITDFKSPQLNLDDPSIYRDLCRPIGALNPQRLDLFRSRFKEMRGAEEAPFLYGTHYSTPGYVLYYLVRKAPEYMLRLQQGRFDAADRLFDAIGECWNGVYSSPADVKELIPEFFQGLGEFLVNDQRLPLGRKQDGRRVDDVVLPPWAASPKEFIEKNRAALESEFVSQNLHRWIDLVFGHLQRGMAAEEHDNLFYYLTYEGAVDMDSIEDPITRKSLEAQITEFGQTPKQLFTAPHPRRSPGVSARWKPDGMREGLAAWVAVTPPTSAPASLRRSTSSSAKGMGTRTGSTSSNATTSTTTASASASTRAQQRNWSDVSPRYDAQMTLSSPHSETLSEELQEPGELLGAGNSDPSCRPRSGVQWKDALEQLTEPIRLSAHRDAITAIRLVNNQLISCSLDGCVKVFDVSSAKQVRSRNVSGLALSALEVASDGKLFFLGSYDNKVYVYHAASGREDSTIEAHLDAVSALAVTEKLLLSASWDATVQVWTRLGSGLKNTPLTALTEHESPVKALGASSRIEGPLGAPVAVSGSDDGVLILWDLATLKMTREIHAHDDAVQHIAFTPSGEHFVSSGADGSLKLFDRSGAELNGITVGSSVKGAACDGEVVVIAQETGQVSVWDVSRGTKLHDLATVKGKALGTITCLAVQEDGKYVAVGTESGLLWLWKS